MGDGERVERASECAVQGPGQVVTGAAAKFNRKFNRRATGVQLGFRLHIHMKSQASSILSVGVLQRSRKERGMKRKRDEDDPTMNDTNYMTQFPSRDFGPQFCAHFSLIAFFDHILCTTQTADNFGQTRMWTFKESNGARCCGTCGRLPSGQPCAPCCSSPDARASTGPRAIRIQASL